MDDLGDVREITRTLAAAGRRCFPATVIDKDDDSAASSFLFTLHRELSRGNTWQDIASGIGRPDVTANDLRHWNDVLGPRFRARFD